MTMKKIDYESANEEPIQDTDNNLRHTENENQHIDNLAKNNFNQLDQENRSRERQNETSGQRVESESHADEYQNPILLQQSMQDQDKMLQNKNNENLNLMEGDDG